MKTIKLMMMFGLILLLTGLACGQGEVYLPIRMNLWMEIAPYCDEVSGGLSAYRVKCQEAVDAGATGIIGFDQFSQGWPFTTRERDQKYIDEMHSILSWLDTCAVKVDSSRMMAVSLMVHNITKSSYGHPVSIPLKRISGPQKRVDSERRWIDFSEVADRDRRVFIDFSLPEDGEFRYYEAWVYVMQGSVDVRYYRTGNENVINFVEDLAGPKLYRVPLVAMESREYTLYLKGTGDTKLFFAGIQEATPPPDSWTEKNDVEYEYLGRRTDAEVSQYETLTTGRFWAGVAPQWEDRAQRFLDYANIDSIWAEFGWHPCVQRGNLWIEADEPAKIGWSRKFKMMFRNCAEGYGTEVREIACYIYELTGKHTSLWADVCIYSHNGKQFIRTNNPRNGGYDGVLDYIPPTCPIRFYLWHDPARPADSLAADIREFEGRDYAVAVYRGLETGEKWAEAVQLAGRDPSSVMCFGWELQFMTQQIYETIFNQFEVK